MQPGTHRKLAYKIRTATPGIRPSYSDPGELRKNELYSVVRALDADYPMSATKADLRLAIAQHVGFASDESTAVDFDRRFEKYHKRQIIDALEEVDSQ